MSISEPYAIYLTTASGTQAVGTVVNRVMWVGGGGSTQGAWTPPPNTAAVADPDGKYPIGSVYEAPSS